jgi:ketosteroid isomerase-like protein
MTDLETRVDRIEGELAIRRLAAEYCHGADKRDLDRFLAVWAPTAVWKVGDDAGHEGRDAIARAVQAQWATFPQYVHWTTNHAIWIDGDQARGECDVATTVRLRSGRWVRKGGTYRDEYRRIDGQWLIARRHARAFDIDPRPDESETRLRFDGD